MPQCIRLLAEVPGTPGVAQSAASIAYRRRESRERISPGVAHSEDVLESRAMGMETTGRLHAIFDTQQKTERFRLREFVVELADNPRYPQYVLFQLTGDRCELLDALSVGDEVRVEFALRGREWQSPKGETRYFNSLDVWTLESLADGQHPAGPPPPPDLGDEPPPPTDDDEIPF